MVTVYEAAQEYTRQGFSIIPVVSHGKRPALAWQQYQSRKSTGAELSTWFGDGRDANIGVVCGDVSGVIVLDVDGPDGLASIAGKSLPPTPCVRTAKGFHYYFRHPGYPVRNFARKLPGLDLRGDGGFVVAPPSVHPSGHVYEWALPLDVGLADVPAWLLNLLDKPTTTTAKPTGWLATALQGVGEGARNDTATRLAGRFKRLGLEPDAILELLRAWNLRNAPPMPDDELQAVCGSAAQMQGPWREPTRFTGTELMARTFEPRRWIVPDVLPQDALVLLASRSKLGKSWLCLQLGAALATGGAFLGHSLGMGKVVYVALEDDPASIQERLNLQGAPSNLSRLVFYDAIAPLNVPQGMDQLEAWLKTERPKLCIIDTLAAAKSGRLDENEAGAVADLVNPLRNLAHDYNTSVLLVHHHGKLTTGDAVMDLRGSSALGAAADVCLALYRERGQPRAKLDGCGRSVRDFSLTVEFDDNSKCWQLVGDTKTVGQNEAQDDILSTLAELGEVDAGQVAKELGKNRTSVREVLMRLASDGKVGMKQELCANGRGKRILFYQQSVGGLLKTPYGNIPQQSQQSNIPQQSTTDQQSNLDCQTVGDCWPTSTAPTVYSKPSTGDNSQAGGTHMDFSHDPREDLESDHDAWERLLQLAPDDGPSGLRGTLHGLRCEGCSLGQTGGKWMLAHGEMDAGDYAKVRASWLQPQADAVLRLLNGL